MDMQINSTNSGLAPQGQKKEDRGRIDIHVFAAQRYGSFKASDISVEVTNSNGDMTAEKKITLDLNGLVNNSLAFGVSFRPISNLWIGYDYYIPSAQKLAWEYRYQWNDPWHETTEAGGSEVEYMRVRMDGVHDFNARMGVRLIDSERFDITAYAKGGLLLSNIELIQGKETWGRKHNQGAVGVDLFGGELLGGISLGPKFKGHRGEVSLYAEGGAFELGGHYEGGRIQFAGAQVNLGLSVQF